MTRLMGVLTVLMMLLGVSVSSASAAPVGGSVSDPQDAPINVVTNQRDTDAKSVSASYDRDTGEFVLTVELWVGVYALPSQYVSVYTEANLHGATCADGPQHMGISLGTYVGPGYPYNWAGMGFNEGSGYSGQLDGQFSLSSDGRILRARFQDAALVRQNIRCIGQSQLSSGDKVSRFCLGGDGCFGSPPPPPPPPPPPASARWVSPKDDQTVSGLLTEVAAGAQKCLAEITGPVVRTENWVDGKLNDTQVYAPWGCVWDTRNYVNGGHRLTVRAYDAADNVIATHTVRVTVNNPNPPPVSTPPPPNVETSPGVVVPSGTPAGSPPAVTPARRFTGSKARRAVKRALARRHGRAFRLRRGYSVSFLKLNESSWRCTVRWRYGQYIYKGKVKLTLRPDGRIASRTVVRKLIR